MRSPTVVTLLTEACATDEERAVVRVPLLQPEAASNETRLALLWNECQRAGTVLVAGRVSTAQAVEQLMHFARALRLEGPGATFCPGTSQVYDSIRAQLYAATGKRVSGPAPKLDWLPSNPDHSLLKGEAAALLAEPWETRFERLSAAAVRVGRLVAAGQLHEHAARVELLLAADHAGLSYVAAGVLITEGFEEAKRAGHDGRSDA